MKIKQNRLLFILDLMVWVLGAFLMSTVNLDIALTVERGNFLILLFVLSGIGIIFSFFFRLYQRVWCLAGINNVGDIIKAAFATCIIFYLVWLMLFHQTLFWGTLIVLWFTLTVGLITVRFWSQLYKRLFLKKIKDGKRVLIIGAGGAGTFVARAMQENKLAYHPIGFVDDDPGRLGLIVCDIPVLGTRKDIPSLVKKYAVAEIIIAIPSASPEVVRKILTICRDTKARVKILPGIKKILGGDWSLQQIRDVEVEDLLHRAPAEINLEKVGAYLREKRVLVTGAGGSIGSEICRQVAGFSPERLILLGHGENSIYEIFLELKELFPDLQLEAEIADIQDRHKMMRVLKKFSPHVVFHAAAHKHVPLMELHPEEAWKNNVLGTKNVAEAAGSAGSKIFVLVSSDKAVNPSNILGGTKKIAELFVQSINREFRTKFVVVRFGNVLGSRGSVVPLFKKQIASGGPVTITHPEMVRFFMTIPEAAQLVIQAGAVAEDGETFVLDMGHPVKILDLARDLITLSGLEPERDIPIIAVGPRPGEKLREELLTKEEKMAAVKKEGLIVVSKALHLKEEVKDWKNLFSRVPENYRETVDLIKAFIPGFPDQY